MRGVFTKTRSLLLACVLAALACPHSPALAAPDEDLQTLEMFYEGKDLVVSATRNPKPISQTAENITVVTAADIAMMGAHTLPEVLNNVPGLQTDDRGSVGTFSGVSIQGADMFHILVMQDGIALNFLGDGSPDIAAIPVQNIERIEIVKGPGSSSWGSALGGVINIVTKSPLEDKKLGGSLSFSAGERDTRETRGEAAGTIGLLGYYMYAGNLTSGGFRPHTAIDANNLYSKLRWELPERGSLLFTIGYTRESSGEGGDPLDLAINTRRHNFLSTLSLNYPLGDRVDLDFSLRKTSRSTDSTITILSSSDLLQIRTNEESTFGGSAKLTWRQRFQSLVVGADFDHGDFDFNSDTPLFTLVTDLHFRSDKWGVFLNDSFTLGNITITPGIRYDRMHPVGDFFSPSLGAAWNLNDKTILRAYAARGYSLPVIIPDSTQEKVVTIQGGVETTQIPHLWLKTTLFRNHLSDITAFDADGNTILERHLKQGVEVEARTVPLFNTSLAAGYTFVDAKNRDTDETLQNIPRQIVKLGLNYDDRRSLRGSLLGRYVWWNASSENNASTVIWDLNLSKKIFTVRDNKVEIFFNARNIFNGAQFSDETFKNARRWVEGGIRLDF